MPYKYHLGLARTKITLDYAPRIATMPILWPGLSLANK